MTDNTAIINPDFEKAMAFTLKWEGNYVNNPADPGGETKFGICKRWYPNLDIANLTIEQAKAIYLQNYWVVCNCDDLQWPLNLVHFDTAVNLGPAVARNILGKITANTTLSSTIERAGIYCFLRIKYYVAAIKNNPNLSKFLTGYLNRVIDLYDQIESK